MLKNTSYYTKILEINEQERYLGTYLDLLSLERGVKEGLTYFKQRIGCSTQACSLTFKSEFDEFDLTFSENVKLGSDQVILEFGTPYPEEVYMYIDFEIFYDYLETWIKKQYGNNSELLILLKEVKATLEI